MSITSFQLKTIAAERVPCPPRLRVEAEAEAAISQHATNKGHVMSIFFEAASETKRHLGRLDWTRRLFIDDSLQCL